MLNRCIGAVVLALAAVAVCAETPAVLVDVDAKPPKLLSEYHLFKGNGSTQEPNDGVVPYDLETPLFSDYALKYRFVWMPKGTSAQYNDAAAFTFPIGAVLIKTFAYPIDARDLSKGRRLIETRLLIHKPKSWVGLPYVWNDEQTEATLQIVGGTVDVNWIHTDGKERTVNYIIPNVNQCKACHIYDKDIIPIGPKARNLNKDFSYTSGKQNQLAHWAKVGYLKGAPDPAKAPKVPVWDDPASGPVALRARAYLDVNCAHCHNPHGPADTTGLNLTYYEDNPAKWGVHKTPVAAGIGSGGMHYAIVPGKPDESFLLFRIESTHPGIMMPQLPRRLVHEEGVALIREWIASMKPTS